MTVDELPTTPGSLATDDRGRRYACSALIAGIVRWLPLTHWETPAPTPEQFLLRRPTVDYVAPEWVDPNPRW